MLDYYGRYMSYYGQCIIIIIIISCTGDCAEAVKMYQQIETRDTPYCWCGLGLAFNLSGSGQEGLQGLLFIIRRCANNPVWLNSIHSSCSVM